MSQYFAQDPYSFSNSDLMPSGTQMQDLNRSQLDLCGRTCGQKRLNKISRKSRNDKNEDSLGLSLPT